MKFIPLPDCRMAMVDDQDYDYLIRFKWSVTSERGYAYRTDRAGQTIYMHNAVVNQKPGVLVDHKNRNRLDNRRSNLRYATRSQNGANKKKRSGTHSKYIGVTLNGRKHWLARLKINYQLITIGTFIREEDAGMAYDIVAAHYHGEFARRNFPNQHFDYSVLVFCELGECARTIYELAHMPREDYATFAELSGWSLPTINRVLPKMIKLGLILKGKQSYTANRDFDFESLATTKILADKKRYLGE